MEVGELETGKIYRFVHSRKGAFAGKFLGLVPTATGDAEPHLLRIEIDTSEGSAHTSLANAFTRDSGRKTTPPTTEKLIRPSLITVMEEVL
jgi:hypothetical protein